MTSRTKVRLSLVGIFLLTVLVGIVDYPKGPNIAIGSFQKELKVHLGLDLQGGTSLLYAADVSKIDAADRQTAVDSVRNVIEQRINAFGVSEPVIQTIRSGEDWRIEIELPGITDINEAVRRIGETPVLAFKTEGPEKTYTEEEKALIRTQNDAAKAKAQDLLEQIKNGADFDALAKEHSQDPGSKEEGGDLGEVSKGQTVAQFDDVVFTMAEVGSVYPEIVETDFGWHIIRVDERNGDKAKVHHILLQKLSETPQSTGINYVDSGLTGEQLSRADVTFDQNTGLPTVSLTFNSAGSDLFAKITRENINKTIAIYLDGAIISAPNVSQEINSGQAVISGSFTLDEAKELAQRLNAGALPIPINLVSQQNIGPTLGQVSIERSLFAGVLGLVMLSIFMIVYYRLPGFLAVCALFIYSLIVLAVFKLWPVTLTLAGIAGFILSIGMAVDANVLIFERLKEELRSGKSVRQSIDEGFKRAWLSIRDSNSSSLITCVILYWFGSSLVRGFAVTLAIGIVVSMFSAITITRNFLACVRFKSMWWYGVKSRKE